jgi:hypothetical protein
MTTSLNLGDFQNQLLGFRPYQSQRNHPYDLNKFAKTIKEVDRFGSKDITGATLGIAKIVMHFVMSPYQPHHPLYP